MAVFVGIYEPVFHVGRLLTKFLAVCKALCILMVSRESARDENENMKTLQEQSLESAMSEAARLDEVLAGLPDESPDAEVEAARSAYYAAMKVVASARIALNKSRATPDQLAMMEEQEAAGARQLAARNRLLERDARTNASTPESRRVIREANDKSDIGA